jgi:prophage regulatory protein
MIEEIWRKPKVLAVTGMRASWLYEAERKGDFPKRVRIGERAVGWRRSEVEKWLNSLSPPDNTNGDSGGGCSHD